MHHALMALAALGIALVLLQRRFRLSVAGVWAAAGKSWHAWRESRLGRHLRDRYPRAWAFVAARFQPGAYLGLHLTLGLLVSLAALWLFAGVAEDVVNHDPLTVIDVSVLQALRAHATPTADRIFVVISLMGSPMAMAVVALAGAARFAWRRAWVLLASWVVAFGGAAALAELLKIVFHRPRPTGAAAFLHGASFSFPSGHSLGSLVGYGMLAYLLVVAQPGHGRRTAIIVAAAVALVLAIGLSRLYLGVHYFSDVVGGYAAGALWLSACISGMEVVRRRQAGS